MDASPKGFMGIAYIEENNRNFMNTIKAIIGIDRFDYKKFNQYVDVLWEERTNLFCCSKSGDNVQPSSRNIAYFFMELSGFEEFASSRSKVYAGFYSSSQKEQPLDTHRGWKGVIIHSSQAEIKDLLAGKVSARTLFDYAPMPIKHWDDLIGALACMCISETWSFGEKTDASILKNYISYTFMKLDEEDTVFRREGKTDRVKIRECMKEGVRYSYFNTGLFTPGYKRIYAVFRTNNIHKDKMFLTKFAADDEIRSTFGADLRIDDRADYFSEPERLILNPSREIVPNYTHIIGDRKTRWPKTLQGKSDDELVDILTKGIEYAKCEIQANYKRAVPQYYRHMGMNAGKIQLLIPLKLTGKVADMALTVERKNDIYVASTCLPLDWAYNNARLIVQPGVDWLDPRYIDTGE